jgi:NAD(P)-dependent dehydrogenase (short-subunit alcohol dehydrogenase family)
MSEPDVPVLARFSLAGKVALVTGASSGLGAGFAVALAQAGADVVLAARRHAGRRRRRVRPLSGGASVGRVLRDRPAKTPSPGRT